MKKAVSRGLQLGIGITFSVFFLYLSYIRIGELDFTKLKIVDINFIYIILGILIFMLSVSTRALMWHKCLYEDFSMELSLRAVFLGMAANMILPFRMGEIVRLGVFQKGHLVNDNEDGKEFFLRVGANLVLERILDGVILIILAIIGVYIFDFSEEINTRINMFRNIVCLIIIISVSVIFILTKFYKTGNCKWKWIKKIAQSMNGVKWNSIPIKALKAGMYLVGCWVFGYISIIFTLMGLGISYGIAIEAAFIIFIMTNIAILFPAAPGGLGLFEYACIYSLDMFDIKGMTAGAAAVLIHVIQYVVVLPVAGYMLIKYKDYNLLNIKGSK